MPTLAEGGRWQKEWEVPRGIDKVNGSDYNASRTLTELVEYAEEPHLLKKLEEAIDVIIVMLGGGYKICDELNLPYTYMDDLFAHKMRVNEVKYAEDYFCDPNVADCLAKARFYWTHEDQWQGNDYY